MNIEVGTIYQTDKTQNKVAARTVCAIFNGTVLYSYPNGPHSWDKGYKTCSLRAFRKWADYSTGTLDSHRLHHWQFLDNCRTLVAEKGSNWNRDEVPREVYGDVPHGTKKSGHQSPHLKDLRYYIDDRIVVVVDTKSGLMNVTRRPVDDPNRPHLNCENPVIYVDEEGNPYRYHGESNTLIAHVEGLLEKVA